MEFLLGYADFLLRTLTVLVAIIVVLLTIAALRGKGRGKGSGQLQVSKLNDFYKALRERLEHELLDKTQLKAQRKAEAKQAKQAKKDGQSKPRVFVLDFDGDLYGEEVQVKFFARLRGEQRFGGLDELKAQIARDAEAAREVLRGVR